MSKRAGTIAGQITAGVLVSGMFFLATRAAYFAGARSVQVTMQICAPEAPDFEWLHAACFGDYGQKLRIHDISFVQKDDGTLDIGPISMKDYKLLESIGK